VSSRQPSPSHDLPVEPATVPLEAVLRDGSHVIVRRLKASDGPYIESAFARLSEESRRLRFLTSKPRLTTSELRYLTEVDGHRHEALCAIDPAVDEGVGVARFVRDETDPTRAEVAVTVVDAWQRRGLGTLLLEALSARAREEGIEHFTALVSSENASMSRLLERLKMPGQQISRLGEVAEYEFELGSKGVGGWLREALRAAAEGDWRLPPGLWEALRSLVPFQPRPH
jgi:RimJ/RimL family protein N-acetyltransferase